MQKYGVNELRRMFLEFFESKGHLAMKSFSLVPHNDNSLLLISCPVKYGFNGAIPELIRTGDTAEKTCYHLSEMYPYRRYRERRKDSKTWYIFRNAW